MELPGAANTKHLYTICTTSAQRPRLWSNIVQMLYKCFVFDGYVSKTSGASVSHNTNNLVQIYNWNYEVVHTSLETMINLFKNHNIKKIHTVF